VTDLITQTQSLLALPLEELIAHLEDRVNALNRAHDGILTQLLLAAEDYKSDTSSATLRVFLVGGAVRDLILGRDVRDLDVVIEGEITKLTDRLTNIDWQFYDRFMTASGVLDTGEIDLITARSERYEAPGQLPTVTPGTIEDDLKRRDFTVNAMALELELLDYVPPENCDTHAGRTILIHLLDPLKGLDDLKAKALRVLHDQSFYDDPTRLYRAVRYMARVGLTPVDTTQRQMKEAIEAGALKTLTNDRIMRELFLNFSDGYCEKSVRMMLDLGLLSSATDNNPTTQEALNHAIEFAQVVEHAPGLCGDDKASLLFGYFCQTAPDFAERFRQCSLPRKLKNAARALETTSPEALAKQLNLHEVPPLKSQLDPPPKDQANADGHPNQPHSPPGTSAYSVKLDAFEGPMDLLLHLIQDNEIDIYDIPVATLCTQYLDYLIHMETARVDIAGEFLVMAATLLEIKSMMLLPDREAGIFEAWDVAEDPRTELVTKLVEYKRYKEAARLLSGLELQDGAYFTREASDLSEIRPQNPETLNEPTEIDLLTEALKRVLTKLDRTDTHREHFFSTLNREPYAVEDAIKALTARLKEVNDISFEALFEGGATRNVVVTTFLALLELLKLKRVRVVQDEMFSGILIRRREPSETEEDLIQESLLEHWYETSQTHNNNTAANGVKVQNPHTFGEDNDKEHNENHNEDHYDEEGETD
jgi:segregation and condensation protein A